MRNKTKFGLVLIIFFLFVVNLPTAFTQTTFTASQLSQYDGKGGHPAYVALRGVFYDVSLAKKLWVNGSHSVCSGIYRMAGFYLRINDIAVLGRQKVQEAAASQVVPRIHFSINNLYRLHLQGFSCE